MWMRPFADLQEIDMAGYSVALEVQVESAPTVVVNVLPGENTGISTATVTESLMSMNRCRVSCRFLLFGDVKNERCKTRRVILFPCYGRAEFRGKL